MDATFIVLVYFFYGLAFFSMGLLVALEGGRSSDIRLRKALRPLAGFGIVHAAHEWLIMFELMGHARNDPIFAAVGLSILAFSFISLAAFGSFLLAYTEVSRRLILLIPIALEAIWVFGLYGFRGHYTGEILWNIADAWTRYTLAIPAALLTSIGLVAQQRAFRRSGLTRFGRDALWAAVAFGWYGLFGQAFAQSNPLVISRFINQDLFLETFGFPIQLFRAITAVAAAVFVIRFLRAFQVETERKIAELQAGGAGNSWNFWNVVYQPVGFLIFLVCAFAECNRTPFDLPECETELVGGYHTEYSSMKLGFYLFAEYINMFVSAAVISTLYFGGYNFPFMNNLGLDQNLITIIGTVVLFAKIGFFIFFFMWIRWTIPRFRYDQLMNLGWKILIPLAVINIFVTGLFGIF